MTTDKQGWKISREVRPSELLTMLLFVLTMLGLVRKSELRVVGLEAATRSNTDSIARLTTAVDKMAAGQVEQHEWIIKHEAAR